MAAGGFAQRTTGKTWTNPALSPSTYIASAHGRAQGGRGLAIPQGHGHREAGLNGGNFPALAAVCRSRFHRAAILTLWRSPIRRALSRWVRFAKPPAISCDPCRGRATQPASYESKVSAVTPWRGRFSPAKLGHSFSENALDLRRADGT